MPSRILFFFHFFISLRMKCGRHSQFSPTAANVTFQRCKVNLIFLFEIMFLGIPGNLIISLTNNRATIKVVFVFFIGYGGVGRPRLRKYTDNWVWRSRYT